MSLLDRVCEHEGFEPKPYPDPLSGGEPYTFGHGLTYITEAESRHIVADRLEQNRQALVTIHPWLADAPQDFLDVLVEMSYQMGVKGANSFTQFLGYASRGEWENAADAGLDSRWAEQTPGRARALMDIVRSLPK